MSITLPDVCMYGCTDAVTHVIKNVRGLDGVCGYHADQYGYPQYLVEANEVAMRAAGLISDPVPVGSDRPEGSFGGTTSPVRRAEARVARGVVGSGYMRAFLNEVSRMAKRAARQTLAREMDVIHDLVRDGLPAQDEVDLVCMAYDASTGVSLGKVAPPVQEDSVTIEYVSDLEPNWDVKFQMGLRVAEGTVYEAVPTEDGAYMRVALMTPSGIVEQYTLSMFLMVCRLR